MCEATDERRTRMNLTKLNEYIAEKEAVCRRNDTIAPELYNANGATFGATFLQRSYDREGSYEL